jgi:hypothetical protein
MLQTKHMAGSEYVIYTEGLHELDYAKVMNGDDAALKIFSRFSTETQKAVLPMLEPIFSSETYKKFQDRVGLHPEH